MQVPLNAVTEFEGGQLVYATAGGLKRPTRVPGSAVIHDDGVAHGVSALTRGVRYALFLLALPRTPCASSGCLAPRGSTTS